MEGVYVFSGGSKINERMIMLYLYIVFVLCRFSFSIVVLLR